MQKYFPVLIEKLVDLDVHLPKIAVVVVCFLGGGPGEVVTVHLLIGVPSGFFLEINEFSLRA